MIKKCNKCNQEKPLEEFSFIYKTDRKKGYCKLCESEYKKEYAIKNKDKIKQKTKANYVKNREKLIQKSRDYYKNNKQKVTLTNKKYRQKNREEYLRKGKEYYQRRREIHLKYCKEYREKNKEKRNQYQREYAKKHPELIKKNKIAWALKNRDKKNKKMNEYRKTPRGRETARRYCQNRRARKNQLRYKFTAKDWENCLKYFDFSCAYCGEKNKKITQDHVIALYKGGAYIPENIVPCCHFCNCSKADNDYKEWATKKFGELQSQEIINKITEWQKQSKKEAV
jgi:hypothetical protein